MATIFVFISLHSFYIHFQSSVHLLPFSNRSTHTPTPHTIIVLFCIFVLVSCLACLLCLVSLPYLLIPAIVNLTDTKRQRRSSYSIFVSNRYKTKEDMYVVAQSVWFRISCRCVGAVSSSLASLTFLLLFHGKNVFWGGLTDCWLPAD